MRDNPRLIGCSITGFGENCPYAPRATYDFVIQAISVLLSLNVIEGIGPRRVPIPVSDLFTGLYGTIATLTAVNRRHQTGEGTIIDVSLLDTQVCANRLHIMGDLLGKQQTGRYAPADLLPQVVVEAADGSVALVIASDAQYQRLVDAMGCIALSSNPKLVDNRARLANLPELAAELRRMFQGIPTSEVVTRLADQGVPVARVNSIRNFATDLHLQDRELIVHIPSPAGCTNSLLAVRLPILFDGQAALPDTSAPLLVQHTAEVLVDPRWGG